MSVDASKLKDVEPISPEALANFERVYHASIVWENDPLNKNSTRHDILNTTKTIGGLLRYIADLENK